MLFRLRGKTVVNDRGSNKRQDRLFVLLYGKGVRFNDFASWIQPASRWPLWYRVCLYYDSQNQRPPKTLIIIDLIWRLIFLSPTKESPAADSMATHQTIPEFCVLHWLFWPVATQRYSVCVILKQRLRSKRSICSTWPPKTTTFFDQRVTYRRIGVDAVEKNR